jgi:hypothetical protein
MIAHLMLVAFAALFCLKVLWNLSVPYVLVMRGQSGGISLMPAIEIILLLMTVAIAAYTDSPLLGGALRIGLGGGALVVASYANLWVGGPIAGWFSAWRRRSR